MGLLCNINAVAQSETIPGEVSSPYPTIINLAIEWKIKGDDNQNGIVSVKFKEKGQTKWNDAMPLRRVPAGENQSLKIIADSVPAYPDFSWENKHSGSIFDLKPNTVYQINLKLHDPDGESVERTIEAKTRPVPKIATDAKVTEIAPGSYDTLYTVSGTSKKPSVYRCSKGKAVFKFIDVTNKEWVYIEGLTIKNPVHDGFGICLNGSSNCVISRCRIDASYGIVAYLTGATNCYISD
ncbi:MAG: hypothetical protein JNL23_00425, partial [Chitinophagaceae bacterium]|nr:hypothetical protein [Chitinophagaceae bacterium]